MNTNQPTMNKVQFRSISNGKPVKKYKIKTSKWLEGMCPCLIEHYGDDKNRRVKLERISESGEDRDQPGRERLAEV